MRHLLADCASPAPASGVWDPCGARAGRPRPGRSRRCRRGAHRDIRCSARIAGERRFSTQRGRDGRDDGGSTTIEAVVVVPVLMFLLLVIVQVVLWVVAAHVVQLAASTGDRAARVLGGSSGLATQQAWKVLASEQGAVTAGHVSLVDLPGGVDKMTVSAAAVAIVPGFSLHVSATVAGDVQVFRAS